MRNVDQDDRRLINIALLVGALLIAGGVAVGAPPDAPGVHFGGDPPAAFLNANHQCMSAREHAAVLRQCELHRMRLGLNAPATFPPDDGIAGTSPPVLYRFFPIGANPDHGDVFNGQFVDLDPAAGATHDYQCRSIVGDGHEGVDCSLIGFAQQLIGTPVFAAKDGTVIFAQDGEPDMNLNGGGTGNLIVIDHGGGVASEYFHLKNGSVSVSVGQPVKAGQQIGKAASSGNSFGPHLHFQTLVSNQVYEPFAGACRDGASGWGNQTPLDNNDLFLLDFGITRQDLNALPQPWWEPWELPTNSQFSTSDANVNIWWLSYNFPINCPFNVRFFRPDISLAIDYSANWGNPDFYRTQRGAMSMRI